MPYYRKKPVVIEAMQFNDLNDYLKISKWIESSDTPFKYEYNAPEMYIQTLEGRMSAKPGDYIIKGVSGEFYPCKPDIFNKTYESV